MWKVIELRWDEIEEMNSLTDDIICIGEELKHLRRKWNNHGYDKVSRHDGYGERDNERYEYGMQHRDGYNEKHNSKYAYDSDGYDVYYEQEPEMMDHHFGLRGGRMGHRMGHRMGYRGSSRYSLAA